MLKRGMHEVSYVVATALSNKLGITKSWTYIAKNLFLSKIPLRGDEKAIEEFVLAQKKDKEDQPLGLIVSVVEPFEITETGLMMDPVRPEEWRARKIEQMSLEMKDFHWEVDIEEAVTLIREIQKRRVNQAVLIHCKAGKSRSAMITCCILALNDLYDPTKTSAELVKLAVKMISEKRKQIHVPEELQKTATIIVERARMGLELMPLSDKREESKKEEKLAVKLPLSPTKLIDQQEKVSISREIVELFFSEPFIIEIVKDLKSYKKLLEYKESVIKAAGHSKTKRVEYIEDLLKLNTSCESNKKHWVNNLLLTEGSVKQLIQAKPFFHVTDSELDARIRKELIFSFKNDIIALFCENYRCDASEVQSLYMIEQKKLPSMQHE